MPSVIPKHLEDKISDNKVIVFIGAGASLDIKKQSGEPAFLNWNKLLESIADLAVKHEIHKGFGLKACIGEYDTKLLLDMVEKIRNELPNDIWRAFLRSTFSIQEVEIASSSLSNFKLISNIPTPLTITTNYDNVYQYASEKNVKTWTQKNSSEVNDLLDQSIDEKAIWHIHGHIDEVDSIVLCSGDYNRFYQQPEIENKSNLSLHLLERIAERYSFLFIGFSLEDPFVLELINKTQAIRAETAVNHYAICLESEVHQKNSKVDKLTLLPVSNYGDDYTTLLKSLATIQANGTPIKNSPLPPAIKNNLPEPEYMDTEFIGEKKILQATSIKEQILESREFIFTIQGEGGVGKSATARFICDLLIKESSCQIDSICWVSSKTEELTLEGINKVKGAISSFAEIRKKITQFYSPHATEFTDEELIKSIPENALIILDNLETISDPSLDYFLENTPNNCKLLITSRRALNKGLSYTPEDLSEDCAIQLATTYLSYLKRANQEVIIDGEIASFVKKIHLNPLAIKWFVVGLYRGVEPDTLFKLHEQDVLTYCIKNIYDNLSVLSKSILDVLRLNGERLTYSKLCYLTNSTYKEVEDAVLDELSRQSLINKFNDDFKYRIEIKTRVQSYLNFYSPLTESNISKIVKRDKRLKGKLENFIADANKKPYAETNLSQVNDDNIVAAIILQEVLLGLKKNSSEKLLNKVNEARINAPNYFECYRTEAAVLEINRSKFQAKRAFDFGYKQGGADYPSYLYHFAKLLMKLGSDEGHDYLSILRSALSKDPKSQEVWLELSRALLFKGNHSAAREEIKKILDSDIELDHGAIIKATNAYFQSYKREMESVTDNNFLALVQEQISEFFLLPRSIRASIHSKRIADYFKEALIKLNSHKSSFRNKKEIDQINLLQETLKGLASPEIEAASGNIYTVTGFNNLGDIEAKRGKEEVTIKLSDWMDTFPSSLLNVGEALIKCEKNTFRMLRPLGNHNEVYLNCFPAVIAYSESSKELVFAHLLDGSMNKVDYKVFTRLSLMPGEPILITQLKGGVAHEVIRQNKRSYFEVIKKDSESKTNTITSNENSNLNTRLTGKVSTIKFKSGFAKVIAGSQEFFLPRSKLLKLNFSDLNVGDIVEFSPKPTKKSGELPAAVNVIRVDKFSSRNKSVKKNSTRNKNSQKRKEQDKFPKRKHGKITQLNNSTMNIKTSNDFYMALKAEHKNWSDFYEGAEVWFTVLNQTTDNNKKASRVVKK